MQVHDNVLFIKEYFRNYTNIEKVDITDNNDISKYQVAENQCDCEWDMVTK